LHFATEHSNYKKIPGQIVAPQFYMSCYNVNITGNGTAIPPENLRVTFPGAYQPQDPGLVFDIFLNKTQYPIPGPAVYKPSGTPPVLIPNPLTVISPVGDPVKDAQYRAAMEEDLRLHNAITDLFYRLGG
jgi:hypothetical protein